MLQKKNINEHNSNWPQIPDHPYRLLIVKCSRPGKTNSLLNLISQQPDIVKFIYIIKIHMKQNIDF